MLVDRIVSCILGISCFLYSVFFSNFAKISVKVAALDFAIFVGEILLGTCLIFLIIKWKAIKLKIRPWHYILLCFSLFVFSKAVYGYLKWGPLALRNSAMFYYPLFAIIGYYCFDKDFLNKIKIFLIAFLGITLLLRIAQDYFLYTYCVIIAALAYKTPRKAIKSLGVLGAVLLFFYYNPFNGSKGIFVSLAITLLYLIIVSSSAIRTEIIRYFSPVVMLLVLLTIIVLTLNPHTKKRISVWAKCSNVIHQFQYFNNLIGEDKSAPSHTRSSHPRVKLYNKNIIKKIDQPAKLEQLPKHAQPSELKQPPGQAQPAQVKQPPGQKLPSDQGRAPEEDLYNILWRMFVWKDMLLEIVDNKAILGMDFGRPFLPSSLIRLRDLTGIAWHLGGGMGWIEPHNSYIHILYRSGIIGLGFILSILGIFIKTSYFFVREGDFAGILLSSALLYWLILANFIVLLELPYFAIPFWSLFGVVVRYGKRS